MDKKLKEELIRLGAQAPELQDHIRQILDRGSRTAAGKSAWDYMNAGLAEFLEECKKALGKERSVKSLRKAKVDKKLAILSGEIEFKVEPGFEDQYPHLYEGPVTAEFACNLHMVDKRTIGVSVYCDSNTQQHRELAGQLKAEDVAAFISDVCVAPLFS